jgi:hypothetical protein
LFDILILSGQTGKSACFQYSIWIDIYEVKLNQEGIYAKEIIDEMWYVIRRRHYLIRTAQSYCPWVKRVIFHFNMKSRHDLSQSVA